MPPTPEQIDELLALADELCDGPLPSPLSGWALAPGDPLSGRALAPGEASTPPAVNNSLVRLNELLRESEELRQLYLSHRELHASLAWNGRGGRIATRLFEHMSPPEPVSSPTLPYIVGRRAASITQSARSIWRTRPLGASMTLASAVALLVALGWLLWPVSPVAQVVRSCDAVWGADSAGLGGAELQMDQRQKAVPLSVGQHLELTSGVAEIQFRSGASILLEGPATLTISGGNQARLKQGKLVANVPPAASGFQVQTPEARVVDLGTEFAVWVNPHSKAGDRTATTEVHVLTGRVEITPDSAANPPDPSLSRQSALAGESLRIAAGTTTLVKIEPQPDQFVRSLPTRLIVNENFESFSPGSIPKQSHVRTLYERSLPGREQSIRVVEQTDRNLSRFGRHVLEIKDNDPERKMANPVIDFLLPQELAGQPVQVRFDFRVLDPTSQPLFTVYNRERFVLLHPNVTLEGTNLGALVPGNWYRATVDMPAISTKPATARMRIERFEDDAVVDPQDVAVTSIHALPGNAVRFGFHSPKVKPAGGLWQIDNLKIRAYEAEKLQP